MRPGGAGLRAGLRTVLAETLDVLLPVRCAGCGGRVPVGGPDAMVCGPCRTRLLAVPGPGCPRCGHPLGTGAPLRPSCLACRAWPPLLERARAAVVLAPPADALVHGLKYEGWRGLAATLGGRMADRVAGDGDPPPVVVPVPTTPLRRRKRGYDQAVLLAREVADRRGWPLLEALVRREGRGTQVALQPAERRANVKGAFVLRPDRDVASLDGGRVVLVDDVLTTGATASEAVRALEPAGVTGVVLVTFARALPELRDARRDRISRPASREEQPPCPSASPSTASAASAATSSVRPSRPAPTSTSSR